MTTPPISGFMVAYVPDDDVTVRYVGPFTAPVQAKLWGSLNLTATEHKSSTVQVLSAPGNK